MSATTIGIIPVQENSHPNFGAMMPSTDIVKKSINSMQKRSDALAQSLQNLEDGSDSFQTMVKEVEAKFQQSKIEIASEGALVHQKSILSVHKAELALVTLFIDSIKDGSLSKKEKKAIKKQITALRNLKNFLSYNNFSSSENNESQTKKFAKEALSIHYSKIEIRISKISILSAADNKISFSERKEKDDAKAKLQEIKEYAELILEEL